MSAASKRFYVYILRDPRPGKNMQPIYVGKGHGGRARYHIRKAASHYNRLLRNVLGSILAANLKPIIEIVHYFEVEADAFRREVALIAEYGRRDLGAGSLCNLTDGGEGSAGAVSTEAQRKYNADPETKRAAAKRIRELWADPEIRKRHADSVQKLHANPEYAKINAERLREFNAQPEIKEAASKRLRKMHTDPDFKKGSSSRASERARRRNADPEFQARCKTARAAVRSKPEWKESIGEKIRAGRAAAAQRRALEMLQ